MSVVAPVITSPLHQAALDYATLGIPVFPCGLLTKKPLVGSNGHKDATTDAETINAWWTEEPLANVATVPGLSGWCVVDVDPPNGEETWQALQDRHGQAPETFTVISPRGGRHLFFTGHLPPTVGTLGPHIDTRGDHSYVLLAPSVTDDGEYQELNPGRVPAPVPAWVGRVIAERKARQTVIQDESDRPLDEPAALLRGQKFLGRAAPLVIGENSDGKTFQYAAQLRDYGISAEVCADMLAAFEPSFDRAWIEEKVANAYRYGQNAAGAWAVPPASETFKLSTIMEKAGPGSELGQDEQAARRVKYRRQRPGEMARRPPATFWDEARTVPRAPEGCRMVIAGRWGSHKTNIALALAMDAIRDHGARVVYCAGEASEGLGRERIPAQCEVRGIAPDDLNDTLAIVEVCPRLTEPAEVDAFITEYADFRPDFVVIDTLSEAITGEDENSSQAASFIMAEAGRIRRAFRCAVILVHHLGKDGSKGARGSSVFAAGADAVLEISFDREAGIVHQKVEKMRQGAAGFTVEWGTKIALGDGKLGTMTVVPIAPEDARVALTKAPGNADRSLRLSVAATLREADIFGVESGINTHTLAGWMAGPPNSYTSPAAYAVEVAKGLERLQDGSRARGKSGKVALTGYFEKVATPGTARVTKLWFLPADDEEGLP